MTDPNTHPITQATRSAIHLETRDLYLCDRASFELWQADRYVSGVDPSWEVLVRSKVDSGVDVRRVRIVSTPPSEYIRFEHFTTAEIIAAGEDVRWLSRRDASDLALPGNDFWLIDGDEIHFLHFDGDGDFPAGYQQWAASRDPQLIAFCVRSFESAWSRATPHAEFKL